MPTSPPPDPGTIVGRWTIIELTRTAPTAAVPYGRPAALCRCDCGSTSVVTLANLRSGISRSCGCLHREIVAAHNRAHKPAQLTSHGLGRHPLYQTWHAMVRRCTDPTTRSWAHYGAKGVTVHPSWLDVRVFVADVERTLGPRPSGCTLDRIDPGGDYVPGNIRWASAIEQRHNRRDSVHV